MRTGIVFPRLLARDLEGLDAWLPDAFAGERNVVIVAFRRSHQALVDSWVPWLEDRAVDDPGLRFYELPTIGRIWAPVRNVIDGGMAAAIREPVVLQRTLTIYGDVRRLTGPLGIDDRSTVTLLVTDAAGTVQWSGTGGFDEGRAREIGTALQTA